MDIIKCLQEKVNNLSNKMYKDDQCKPVFIISLVQRYGNDGKINEHEIGLTIQHMNQTFTRTLFPQTNYRYGYPDLEEKNKYIYKNTM